MTSLKKVPNITCEEITNKCSCPHCEKQFSSKSNLSRHLSRNQCMVINSQNLDNRIANIVTQKLEAAMKHLTLSGPVIHTGPTNNLNVMCLGSKDNLLDILTIQTNLPEALTYVKNSALGRLAGDCRILERVYLSPNQRPAIMYGNKSKTQYVYFNENNDRVVESNKEVVAKKLADILQRTYLKGMQSFQIDLCGNIREEYTCNPLYESMPEVESYDLQLWNSHIHDLRDEKYQKKVLKNLRIPVESEVHPSLMTKST